MTSTFPPLAAAPLAGGAAFGSGFFAPLTSTGASSFLTPLSLSSASFFLSSRSLFFSSSLLKSQIAYLNSKRPSLRISNDLVTFSPYYIGPKFKFFSGASEYLL